MSNWNGAAKMVFGGLALGLASWMSLHALGVIGTAATAPGRVINKTLETNNIITNYEWFHDANAQYVSRIGQIKSHSKLLAEETNPVEKSRLNVDKAAMQQSCRDLATKYNAASEKINKNVFKGSSLPDTLSAEAC